MNNFFNLVAFEYKKLFVRKSVYIAIVLLICIAALSTVATVMGVEDVNDPNSRSNYEVEMIYKEKALALSGQELDGELIMEAAQAYSTIPDDVYPYTDSEEYQDNALAYSKVFTTVDSAYASRNESFDYKKFGELTQQMADDYYFIRENQYRLNLENNPLFTQANVERIMAADSNVVKPIVLEYAAGYTRHIRLSTSNSIIIMLVIAFIISPIFSNEHQTRTDNLILTSKNGRRQIVLAKTLAALTLGQILVVLTTITSYLGCMFVFGFEGANASIQNFTALSTYNFTMLEVTIAIFILTLFASFLMAAICLFFSAFSNKNSLALILSVLVIFIEISSLATFLGKAKYFFPSAIASYNTFYLQLSFNVLGIDVWLYQAVCIVAFVVGVSLLICTYYKANRQQVV